MSLICCLSRSRKWLPLQLCVITREHHGEPPVVRPEWESSKLRNTGHDCPSTPHPWQNQWFDLLKRGHLSQCFDRLSSFHQGASGLCVKPSSRVTTSN